MKKVALYFKQLFTRLRSSTPPFFKVIQMIGGLAAAVAGFPTLLEAQGVILPEPFKALADKTIAIAGLVALFIARLPTNDNRVINQFKQQQTPEQRAKAIEDLGKQPISTNAAG